MKASPFEYEKPGTLQTALALLAQHREATVLAGGQSLGPLLNLRMAQPKLLIDVRGLAELSAVRDVGDAVELGACVTHAAIEDGGVPDPTRGLLRSVARGIAYRAVRNRGTLGGSLAHADPAADWVSVMALLEADVLVRSAADERRLPAATFMTGPLSTRLMAGEIIVSIRIPKFSERMRTGYYKFNRKPGEFAEAIGAVLVDPERGIHRAIIGATAGAPFVIEDASALLDRVQPSRMHEAVTTAGFIPGSYEHRVHMVALQRAAAKLQ
jgi:aerobic carbon-monoxide dehydrogenase medium subunit